MGFGARLARGNMCMCSMRRLGVVYVDVRMCLQVRACVYVCVRVRGNACACVHGCVYVYVHEHGTWSVERFCLCM